MDNLEDMKEGELMLAPTQPVTSVRPAYAVRKLEGKVSRTVIRRNAKSKRLEKVEVEEPAGFMLFGMKRRHGVPTNSIRVRDVEELRRLGVSPDVPLLNEDGDRVGTVAL